MVSKAWYKPSAIPQLVARFDAPSSCSSTRKKIVEIWTTTCIVSNFGKSLVQQCTSSDTTTVESLHRHLPECSILINPANPNLSGPNKFPYFARGGPQPASLPTKDAHHIMGYVTQWGGMDVGNGMMLSAETIDGLVHQLGGLRLRAECSLLPTHPYANAYINQQSGASAEDDYLKCPVGTAVITSSSGSDELQKHYDTIIHTTPPFYNYPPLMTEEIQSILGVDTALFNNDKKEENDDDDSGIKHLWSKELLHSCYRQSFKLAFDDDDGNTAGKENGGFIQNSLRSMFGFNNNSAKPIGKRRRQRVAVPLLGAGCRDFPKSQALCVAATESAHWLTATNYHDAHCEEETKHNTDDDEEEGIEDAVIFGLLEKEDAEILSHKIESKLR